MINQKVYDQLLDAIQDLSRCSHQLGLYRTAEKLHSALRTGRSERFEAQHGLPVVRWKIGVARKQHNGPLPGNGRVVPRTQEEADMVKEIRENQNVDVEIDLRSARGNPTRVQDPQWATSDPAIATVTPSAENPMRATVSAVGPTGTAMVQFTGDADLDEGEVRPLIATGDIVVTAGEAVVAELRFGDAVDQTEAPVA